MLSATAVGDDHSDGASGLGIGGPRNGRRGVVACIRYIDRDGWRCCIDITCVRCSASITSWVCYGGDNSNWSFCEGRSDLDCVSSVGVDGGGESLLGTTAVSDDHSDGAAGLGIGGSSNGRRGVVGGVRYIDRNGWCCGVYRC